MRTSVALTHVIGCPPFLFLTVKMNNCIQGLLTVWTDGYELWLDILGSYDLHDVSLVSNTFLAWLAICYRFY